MLLAPCGRLSLHAPRLASEPQPSYLSSSTDCTLQQFGAWSSCHGSYPALWPFSTEVWGVVTVLFTACLPWSSRNKNDLRRAIGNHIGMLHPTSRWRANCQTSSCHGPAGGAQAAGIGRGGGGAGRAHPGGNAPQLGAAGRDSHQGTYKLRPISNCDALPSHVVPLLARFGAPPTYVTAAWCGPITIANAGERSGGTQQYDPKVQHASVGGC
jgi:hypothetical protein